jgi:hypothetical protein
MTFPLSFWKAPMATATIGSSSPSATYTPNGMIPAHRRSSRRTYGRTSLGGGLGDSMVSEPRAPGILEEPRGHFGVVHC